MHGKLEIGFQFEGNRPPEANKDRFATQTDNAIPTDMLSNDRDAGRIMVAKR